MINIEYEQVKYNNAVPSYLENPQVKPFYHAHLKHNLEGISLKAQPERGTSSLEKIF